MKRRKYLELNLEKLESVSDTDWIKALKKCRKHVAIRLQERTLFGAHTQERLGMDPVDYYLGYAYDAILNGDWEWKNGRTLGQQMVRIAENRIGKEVEKYKIEHNGQFAMPQEDIDKLFYAEIPQLGEPISTQEALFGKRISIIEEAVKGEGNLEIFWECVKEGMKRADIAKFMEMSPKQIDKIREKLVNKVKNSLQFQF